MAFSLGRPDSLGDDSYHTLQYPIIADEHYGNEMDVSDRFAKSSQKINPEYEPLEMSILNHALSFARLTKRVSYEVYMSLGTLEEKAIAATEIDKEMETWRRSLPLHLRFEAARDQKQSGRSKFGLLNMREAAWAVKQKLVLSISKQFAATDLSINDIRLLTPSSGHNNVRMLTFRPFLVHVSSDKYVQQSEIIMLNAEKCIASAKDTIEIMHDAFTRYDYFRTWYTSRLCIALHHTRYVLTF